MLWEPGTATGLGPFPGVDPLEAARVVFSELASPGLPFLPELPARGVGSDPVGRTAGLLADLHIEVGVGVWRFVPRGGRDELRARDALTTDLDAVEEVAEGYDGGLKIRIVGPWSLVASIELAKGEKALADEGAVRDITDSLAEGLTRHLADVRRRLPALRRLVVQVDEPLLAAVVAGELATASGWGRLRSFERAVVEDGLRRVLAPAGGNVGGEDGAGVWIGATKLDGALLRGAGAAFAGLDGAVIDSVDEDEVGEGIDTGLTLLVASVPLDEPRDDPRDDPSRSRGRGGHPERTVAPVRSLWKRLGFTLELLPRVVALAPVEGLEQLSDRAVPAVLRRALAAARYLEESAAEEES